MFKQSCDYVLLTPQKTLDYTCLSSLPAARTYLLDGAQHVIGGFGKLPGDPPDIYHSYLSLATLGIMGESSVKSLDPILCLSEEAKARIEACWQGWVTNEGNGGK